MKPRSFTLCAASVTSSVRTRLFQSESFRHTAIYTALFVGSMAVLVAIVYLIMHRAFEADLLRASSDDLLAIQKAYVSGLPRGKGVHEAREMIEDRMLAPDAADRFLLQNGRGIKIAGNLPPMVPKSGVSYLRYPSQLRAGRPGDGHVILGRGALLSPDLYAFVGRDTQAARETESSVLRAFGLVLLASLMMASGSGLLLSRSFLYRIDIINDTCRAIMAGRLGDRIPIAGKKSELERLAATINGMLDRIQVLMESLRQVTTDIAHDMRTPLTYLRYRLEQARSDSTSMAEYASALEGAIANTDQLLTIFSALLRIAQIEAGARQAAFREVDLSQLLRKASDIYKPVMEDAAHPFEVNLAGSPRVLGDQELLLQMIANLLDNAITHTPQGTLVCASVSKDDAGTLVVVADAGPGIPSEDREKVFRRFYRREQSRTSPGSGLGLSLVSAIADLHGANINLDDNAPGLRVIVRFPDEGQQNISH